MRFGTIAGLPLAQTGLEDLMDTLKKGYEVGRQPKLARMQDETSRLANALSQRKLDYPGLDSSNELVQLAALMEYGQRNRGARPPMGAPAGEPSSVSAGMPEQAQPQGYVTSKAYEQTPSSPYGELGTPTGSAYVNPYEPFVQDAAKRFGVNSPYYNVLNAISEQKGTNLQRQKQIIGTAGTDILSPDAKRESEAIARGIGIPSHKYGQGLASGKDLYQQAWEMGYTPEQVDQVAPLHAPTGSNITDLVGMRGNKAAADVLHKRVSSAVGKNVRTVLGYSPKNIADQLSGKNKKQQGEYLGGLALGIDQAALQVNMAGAPATQATVNHLTQSLMSDAKVARFLVDPDVYQIAQDYIQDTLTKMFEAREGAVLGTSLKNFSQQNNNMFEGMELYIDEEGNYSWEPKGE